MATTAPPRPTTQVDAPAARLGVTQARVVRAEWIKLRSVHSTAIGFLAAAIVAVALGLVFSSVAGDGGRPGDGPGPGGGSDPGSLSLAGFNLAQIVVGVLGVITAAGEYSTGLIRTTLAAVTTRLPVLWAKVAVVGAVTLVVTGVAALAAFLGGQAIYGGAEVTASLSDPGVLRAVLGTAVYCTGVAVIGVAVGFGVGPGACGRAHSAGTPRQVLCPRAALASARAQRGCPVAAWQRAAAMGGRGLARPDGRR